MNASFTKLVSNGSRELKNDGVGGSMMELGSYPLLAIFKLLGNQYEDIHFTSFPNEEGVDLFTRMELRYSCASASAKVGLGVKTEGDLVISGTRGYVYVPAPWWKTEYFELRYENPADNERDFYKFSGDGLRYEIVEFLRQIKEGRVPPESRDLSQAIAQTLEIYRSGEHNKILLRKR